MTNAGPEQPFRCLDNGGNLICFTHFTTIMDWVRPPPVGKNITEKDPIFPAQGILDFARFPSLSELIKKNEIFP